MIGVFVTFKYGKEFEVAKVIRIADNAKTRFTGMPGLRTKIFTVDPDQREARNVYLWDSIDAAKAFFTDELRERVTGMYGVAPTIEFVQIAGLVENASTRTPHA